MSRDILFLEPTPADARIGYGPDPLQFGDLRVPADPGLHPVVVVVHGGFWRAQYDLAHVSHLCTDLTARGVATWSLEYRRLGQPFGGWPGTFHDVALGADALRDIAPAYDLDLTRVATVGHSAGGQLALWLAGRHRLPPASPLASPSPLPIRWAVALAGVVDLRLAWELNLGDGVVPHFMGGPPSAVPERYAAGSPIELLPLGVRQTLVHGTDDAAVPIELSDRYVERAAELGDPATLVALEGAGHFEVIDPRADEWEAVAATVLAPLRPAEQDV
ncbi:MAG: S9 family peptidase [Chloroflexota bacterium]|nr:S9 family peptidase [Chloroflexota bacterium]